MKKRPNVIVLIIFIVITGYITSKLDILKLNFSSDDLSKIQNLHPNTDFIDSSLMKYEIDEQRSLIFINSNSSQQEMHVFYKINNKVLPMGGMFITEEPIAYRYAKFPDKPNILLGRFNDAKIDRIKVNNISENKIKIISRYGFDIFFVFDQEIQLPIKIEGFTKNGEKVFP